MAKKKGKASAEDMYSMYAAYQEPETNQEETAESYPQGVSSTPEAVQAPPSVKYTVGSVERNLERMKLAPSQRKETDYRSPICCILGHADTGKTKILDRVRESNVQLQEAGGITQQIGATYIPIEELEKKYAVHSEHLPGLLIIDTPGHEAFSNLRTRGSSICNIVVLVIDIMHGLELQTKESIDILRQKKTPFVIALNKIDRISQWVSHDGPFSIKKQCKAAQLEFKERHDKIMLDLSMEGLNSAIFLKNPDPRTYISIVPTSAVTGEGISDLLSLLVSLVETRMLKRVKFEDKVECMVLEARSEEGKAPCIDVILSNGVLSEGDRIVICTQTGAVDTVIRKLLTPHPMKEIRVKSKYVENKQVKAAAGVRIVAPHLEGALAGSKIYIVTEENIEETKKKAEEQIRASVQSMITGASSGTGNIFDVVGEDGIHAQASTLGALEALIVILKEKNIPIRTIGVGNISKKDLIKTSTIQERRPEYSAMLCFDVTPSQEMRSIAQEMGVKIITAEIIYHLTEKYKAHMEEFWEKAAEALKDKIVFPCILKVVPGCFFTKRSPLIMGVCVQEGILRLGTPLVVIRDGVVTPIGKITSIMEDTKTNPRTDKLKPKAKASIKVEVGTSIPPVIVGRKLFETDEIYSRLTRESIDLLKDNFKDALSKEEWLTVIKIKKVLGIL
ncbi:translation initiation factor 5B [Nematocida sp. AWRm77]|nr:translation initiation factor 5B [Nematocida sp. AWRm77]